MRPAWPGEAVAVFGSRSKTRCGSLCVRGSGFGHPETGCLRKVSPFVWRRSSFSQTRPWHVCLELALPGSRLFIMIPSCRPRKAAPGTRRAGDLRSGTLVWDTVPPACGGFAAALRRMRGIRLLSPARASGCNTGLTWPWPCPGEARKGSVSGRKAPPPRPSSQRGARLERTVLEQLRGAARLVLDVTVGLTGCVAHRGCCRLNGSACCRGSCWSPLPLLPSAAHGGIQCRGSGALARQRWLSRGSSRRWL